MTSSPAADAAPQDSFAPFERVPGGHDRAILLCDHAANLLPARYGSLGLDPAEFERHIAYDIGARAVTLGLARRLGATAVLSRFSRLLIDPNRGEDDPTLVMRLSDRTIIPGNRHVDAAERERRLDLFHRPYHRAIDEAVEAALAAGSVPAIVSIHSFTPRWWEVERKWHVGILWDADPRLPLPLIEALAREGDLHVGDNEPYDGALRGDTLHRHATRRGLAHALVEIRQDLIGDQAGAAYWADRLAAILDDLLKRPEMHRIEAHGSRTGAVDIQPGGHDGRDRQEN